MAANGATGATHRKGSAQDEVNEDMGHNYLQQIKSSGGLTITPELFERVSHYSLVECLSMISYPNH
jgi:hypothetical protein